MTLYTSGICLGSLLEIPKATVQKQSPEVFYKKAVFKTFRNIHRKTAVLESLFNKAAGLACLATLMKETPSQTLSIEYCEVLKNTHFKQHLQTAAFRLSFYKKLYVTCSYHKTVTK